MMEYISARMVTALSGTKREDGQALVEYALILFLIAVVSLAVLTLLGTNVSSIISKIANAL